MRRYVKALVLLSALLLVVALISGVARVHANTFTPPTQITVNMYRLYPSGARKGVVCNSGDYHHGCTANCNDYAYPTCATPALP